MRILIFGGTTEGRVLAERLSVRHTVTVSVATALGAEALGDPGCAVRLGRLDAAQMAALAAGCDLVVDATHPYASQATKNIRAACEAAKVPCRRVLREASGQETCIQVSDCRAAAEYLAGTAGNVLIATGSKNLRDFRGLSPDRLFPRVLPTHEALSACEALGIPHRNILAMQGPFTLEMNMAILRQFHIRFLVTKDGGRPGGFPEKQEAARRTGAVLILVSRPEDNGIGLEALLDELEAMA